MTSAERWLERYLAEIRRFDAYWGGPSFPAYNGFLGGGGQNNTQQASTASAQQTAANAQDMAISQQNQALQQRMVNMLFGNGTAGSSGSLTGMLNPANLTQAGLSPAYQAQFKQGENQIGQSTAQQRGQLAQSFANSGLSANATPSGFQADQMRQLGSSQADQQGQLYSGLMGSQYNNALQNFWNANNIASGNAATGASTSTSAAGNSGSSSAQVYGTAGQTHPNQGLQVAGQVGAAAMCPADGSQILMAGGEWKKVEELKPGDIVLGIDRRGDEVIDIQPTLQNVCTLFTIHGQVTVSESHTFERHSGGYTFARQALGECIDVERGGETVIEVRPLANKLMCRHIMLKRSHGYCVDGFWSLE